MGAIRGRNGLTNKNSRFLLQGRTPPRDLELRASLTAALKRGAQKTCLARRCGWFCAPACAGSSSRAIMQRARAAPAERKNTARATRRAFCIYNTLGKNEHVKFDTNKLMNKSSCPQVQNHAHKFIQPSSKCKSSSIHK